MFNTTRSTKPRTQKRTISSVGNITNTIKKILGQYTYIEKKKIT